MGTPTQGGVASCHGVARSAKTEMPVHQYEALLFRLRAHALRRDRVPPHHPVGFGLFLRYTHGFRSRCLLHPWLLYAALPCGEAPEFRSLRSPDSFSGFSSHDFTPGQCLLLIAAPGSGSVTEVLPDILRVAEIFFFEKLEFLLVFLFRYGVILAVLVMEALKLVGIAVCLFLQHIG